MTEQLPDRTFGWSNMFVATRESDPREQGDPPVGERDTQGFCAPAWHPQRVMR